MITKFEIFESDDNPYFYVGEEVTCIEGIKMMKGNMPLEGKKYIVIRIYQEYGDDNDDKVYVPTIIEHEYLTEKDIDDWYVDIKDIEDGDILIGWQANRFKSDFRTKTNKFNI